MHYSRLLLNLASSRARRDIANDFEMHRTVMSAFPALTERERSDPDSGSILWRVDHDQRRGLVLLIVQSELPPNWQPLLDKYPGYVTSPPDSDLPPVTTMERHLAFQTGQRLTFRLRANPTKKLKVEGRKNGQRVGLISPDEQLGWLRRKAEDEKYPVGFRLLKSTIVDADRPRRDRSRDSENDSGTTATATRQLTHVAVRFEGLLEVTDPIAFQQTLRCGIGSAKGFGFGLLSVARASQP